MATNVLELLLVSIEVEHSMINKSVRFIVFVLESDWQKGAQP